MPSFRFGITGFRNSHPPEAALTSMTPHDPEPTDTEPPDPDKLRDESRESIERVRRMIVPDDESSTGEEPPLLQPKTST
jgi:hypothetical protein